MDAMEVIPGWKESHIIELSDSSLIEMKKRERGSEKLRAVVVEHSGRGPEAMSIGIWEIRLQISFGLRCRENPESCLVVK